MKISYKTYILLFFVMFSMGNMVLSEQGQKYSWFQRAKDRLSDYCGRVVDYFAEPKITDQDLNQLKGFLIEHIAAIQPTLKDMVASLNRYERSIDTRLKRVKKKVDRGHLSWKVYDDLSNDYDFYLFVERSEKLKKLKNFTFPSSAWQIEVDSFVEADFFVGKGRRARWRAAGVQYNLFYKKAWVTEWVAIITIGVRDDDLIQIYPLSDVPKEIRKKMKQIGIDITNMHLHVPARADLSAQEPKDKGA